MSPPAFPGLSLLPSPSGAAVSIGLTPHPHVLMPVAILIQSSSLIYRISDSIIGLSCLALAATLASFLLSARGGLRFRLTLVGVTIFTAIAGLVLLFSGAVTPGLYVGVVQDAPLVLAALFLIVACVLPLLLPLLLSKSRELDTASVVARTNETRFQAVVEGTDDAFMLLDALRSPDGRIEDFLFTYLNANAEKIILKPHSQVVGARITRVLPIKADGKLFDQFRQVVLTGKPLVHEFPLYRDDPSGPWMRHQVAKLDDGLAITASDITERKHAEQDMMPQLEHDFLTGLPNRSLLNDRMEQAIARAVRYQTKVAVLLVNLDGFEEINQEHGRGAGDEVLRVMALRLRSAVRGTDSVIRLDGDEFILVMPDMMLAVDVRRTAATLIAIARKSLTIADTALQVRCSIGVAVYPDTGTTLQELLTGSDIAMCRAKAQGHNHYVIHEPTSEPWVESGSGSVYGAERDVDVSEDVGAEQYAD